METSSDITPSFADRDMFARYTGFGVGHHAQYPIPMMVEREVHMHDADADMEDPSDDEADNDVTTRAAVDEEPEQNESDGDELPEISGFDEDGTDEDLPESEDENDDGSVFEF